MELKKQQDLAAGPRRQSGGGAYPGDRDGGWLLRLARVAEASFDIAYGVRP
jgi:hypothetical protein